MTDGNMMIKQEVVERYKKASAEYQQVHEKIKELHERLAILNAIAKDCHAAARLFNFDLVGESSTLLTRNLTTKEDSSGSKTAQKRTVREFILDEAKKAHPNPVRAGLIQKALEAERGEKVHYKTVGMTLYRLSIDGLMKRNKYDWFFVPEENRNVSDGA